MITVKEIVKAIEHKDLEELFARTMVERDSYYEGWIFVDGDFDEWLDDNLLKIDFIANGKVLIEDVNNEKVALDYEEIDNRFGSDIQETIIGFY